MAVSHTLAVLSQLPVTTRRPSGEIAADRMVLLCPVSVCSSVPLAAFQTLAVPSSLQVAIRLPSGEMVTDLTGP